MVISYKGLGEVFFQIDLEIIQDESEEVQGVVHALLWITCGCHWSCNNVFPFYSITRLHDSLGHPIYNLLNFKQLLEKGIRKGDLQYLSRHMHYFRHYLAFYICHGCRSFWIR